MGVLFMVSSYTLREAPSGHFKAEEVCMCSLWPETTTSPRICTSSRGTTTRHAEASRPGEEASPTLFLLCVVLVEAGRGGRRRPGRAESAQ